MQIFIHRDDQEFGPYSVDQIKEFLTDGSVNGEDYCRVDGDAEWSMVSRRLAMVIPARYFTTAPSVAPPRSTQNEPAANPPTASSESPGVAPAKKKWGCLKIGCVGLLAIPVLFIGLLVIGSMMPRPPTDPDWDKGWNDGLIQGGADYRAGEAPPSDEVTAQYARGDLNSEEYKNFAGNRQTFIEGYESGYSQGWNNSKTANVNGN